MCFVLRTLVLIASIILFERIALDFHCGQHSAAFQGHLQPRKTEEEQLQFTYMAAQTYHHPAPPSSQSQAKVQSSTTQIQKMATSH